MASTSTKRICPLHELSPYEPNWTIKVRVTAKTPLKSYNNIHGQGNVFSVELIDEYGTEIQATMFKEAAQMFYDMLQVNKMYYISRATLRRANRQYTSVNNDYQIIINTRSIIEEITEDQEIPRGSQCFTKISRLPQYINSKTLLDIIGIVCHVASTTPNTCTKKDRQPVNSKKRYHTSRPKVL